MKKFTILFVTFLNFINYITSDDTKCDSFKCVNSLVSNLCMQRNTTETNVINIQTCEEKSFCSYNLKAVTGTCQKIDYSTKQFIGGKCKKVADCITEAEFCDGGLCLRNSTTTCKSNLECPIGKYCNIGKDSSECKDQLKSGETCSKDNDCVNTAGCFNGNCTNYFTLPDNTNIISSKNEIFCQSGFAVNNICSSGALVSSSICTTTGICTYRSNNTDINSTDACVCGKNYNGNKYCRFGVDNDKFKASFDFRKKLLNANSTCHTEERFVPCASNSFDSDSNTHNEFDYKKSIKTFHNSMVENSVSFSDIPKNDTCILPVVGGYDNNLIPPVSMKSCPSYVCQSNQKSCGLSNNPNNWDSSNIQITLSKGVCMSNQTCSTSNLGDIYSKESVSLKCENKIEVGNRFPGEKCSSNDDCKNKNCTNGNCNFVPLGQNCSTLDLDKFCGLNAYCKVNTTDLTATCAELQSKDQECSMSFDCKNDLLCYNKTCSIDLASKDDSFKFDPKLISQEDTLFKNMYCKSLFYDSQTNRCVTYKYDNMTVNNDGFVECSINDGKECKYVNSLNNTFTQKCDCGYNAAGKSYCPIDFSKRKKIFLLYLLINQFKIIFF